MVTLNQIAELQRQIEDTHKQVQEFVKLPITHPDYVENHKAYLRLEFHLDELIHQYFQMTGTGKQLGGYYFHD